MHNSKPEHVLRWTNARVCQWLESIEMGEYVPNLKETGVHGAMLVRMISVDYVAY